MTDLRTIIAGHGQKHNELATRYSLGQFTDDDAWIAAINAVDEETERAILTLSERGRLEETCASSQGWDILERLRVKRLFGFDPHVPGTTDEPVAPEYKDARWGKPK